MMGIFFSCQNDMDVIMDITGDDTEPGQIIENAEYLFTEKGKLQNKLSAGLMKQYSHDSTYIIIEKNLKLEIFDENEMKVAQLTSKNGIYYENSAKMEAIDSVVFSNIEGETLLTERLVWLQDSATIYSEDPITIHRDGGVIYGDGIVSNESFTRYSITRPRGELEMKQMTQENE
ncbi:MAG: LPS export ABC transporter protein LptC [Patiriisocius sp.]|jgi:LPS export ABC transporter protein LptC